MNEKRAKNIIFFFCFFGYSLSYVCRMNFSAAMPSMTVNGFTSEQLAFITSCYFFSYGTGQLIFGILGDRISPKRLLFFGLLLTGCSNFWIGFVSDYRAISVFWLLNGIAQAMLWPPIMYLIANYYGEKERQSAVKIFSVSVPVGTLSGYGLSALLLQYLKWKYVFIVPGALLLTAAFCWVVVAARLFQRLKHNDRMAAENISTEKHFLKNCIFSGLPLMILPIAVHGALKDSVSNWVPTFITETFSITTGDSVALTMILPIVNIFGGFAAIRLNRRLKNEVLSSSFFFLVAVAACILLSCFGKSSLAISLICIPLITCNMFAVNLLTISLIPLHFSGFNRVSSVSGGLNSIAYLGCAVVNFAVGVILPDYSWRGVMTFWTVLALISFVFCLVAAYFWKKYILKRREIIP